MARRDFFLTQEYPWSLWVLHALGTTAPQGPAWTCWPAATVSWLARCLRFPLLRWEAGGYRPGPEAPFTNTFQFAFTPSQQTRPYKPPSRTSQGKALSSAHRNFTSASAWAWGASSAHRTPRHSNRGRVRSISLNIFSLAFFEKFKENHGTFWQPCPKATPVAH